MKSVCWIIDDDISSHYVSLSFTLSSSGQVSVDIVLTVNYRRSIENLAATIGFMFDNLNLGKQLGTVSNYRVGLVSFGESFNEPGPRLVHPLSDDKDSIVNAALLLPFNDNLATKQQAISTVYDVATNNIRGKSVEPQYPSVPFPPSKGYCNIELSLYGETTGEYHTLDETVAVLNDSNIVYFGMPFFAPRGQIVELAQRTRGGIDVQSSTGSLPISNPPSYKAYIASTIQACITRIEENNGIFNGLPHYNCGADYQTCGICPNKGKYRTASFLIFNVCKNEFSPHWILFVFLLFNIICCY